MNNEFLHGDLKKDVYMPIPRGVPSTKPNQVCKLVKSLYGLKQTSRKWNEKLMIAFLLALNFTQAHFDHSLFVRKTPTSFTILLVYVDGVIVTGDSLNDIKQIKSALHQ
jgi:hypothetical protein